MRFCAVVLWAAVLWAALAGPLAADVVVVENATGNISVRVADREDVEVRGRVGDRAIRPDDIRIERKQAAGFFVRAEPGDGAAVHLDLEVPYQTSLGLTTVSGKIAVEGMPAALDVETETGDLDLALPWRAAALDFVAEEAPARIAFPETIRQKRRKGNLRLSDKLDAFRHRGYSAVRVRTRASPKVLLREIPIPEDSPIKLHWQAPDVLQGLFSAQGPVRLQERDQPRPSRAANSQADFRTDVRLVDLLAHVTDKKGRPVTDLEPEDFRVFEDNEAQSLRSAELNPIPLNIVIFLDWSGSMASHRTLTLHAINEFIENARIEDRIAVHVCFRETLYAFPRLTADRRTLRAGLKALDALHVAGSQAKRDLVRGSSPIWDAALLAAADEIPDHDRDLNVFIPITDGVDNTSRLSFKEFLRAAREMNMAIFPITPNFSIHFRGDPYRKKRASRPGFPSLAKRLPIARAKLERLAEATGGQVFEAASPKRLGAVLQEVIAKLRGAYALSYAPSNREYDGEWRSIRVEVDRPDVTLRYRPGYMARP